MHEGRRIPRQQQAESPYRRPAGQPSPAWMGAEDEWVGQQSRRQRVSLQEYEETAEDEYRQEPPVENRRTPRQQELIATNSTVRLTCTLAAMMSLFALFLCFAEKKSRAIRHFAVQSTALAALHMLIGFVLLATGFLLSGVPFLGLLTGLCCWLCYIAALIAILCARVRMMLFAWRGERFALPMLGRRLERYLDVHEE